MLFRSYSGFMGEKVKFKPVKIIDRLKNGKVMISFDYAQKKSKISSEKFYVNIAEYENTSSASIPIALDEMAEKNLLQRGMKVLMVGFGGGLTWGGTLIEW